MTKGPGRFTLGRCVFSPKIPQELLLLLDNEKGGDAFPVPLEGRKHLPDRKRAVLMGQVWSADLAETLMEVYSHLLSSGYSLEDVSRFVQEPSDDPAGD